jgi:hypothetical protein
MRNHLYPLDPVMRNRAVTTGRSGAGTRAVSGLVLVLAILVVGCTPAPETPAPPAPVDVPAAAPVPAAEPPAKVAPAVAWENRLGNLPPDAAAVIDRVDSCTHFSGEFNGDRSERDREVAAKLAELHCDTIEQEAANLRELYADRPDVLEALAMATEGAR